MELGRLGVRGVPVQKRVEMVPKVGLAHAPEHGAQERRVPITEAVHQTRRPAIKGLALVSKSILTKYCLFSFYCWVKTLK